MSAAWGWLIGLVYVVILLAILSARRRAAGRAWAGLPSGSRHGGGGTRTGADRAPHLPRSPRIRPQRSARPASSSSAYRTGVRFSTWWLRRYTRRVDPRYTTLRDSEVTMELWEHAIVVDERGWRALRATTGLVGRTMAAMPRDWSWRRAALAGEGYPGVPAVRLLGGRQRSHFWVPMQQGHLFDQTNGMLERERALASRRGRLGATGSTPPM